MNRRSGYGAEGAWDAGFPAVVRAGDLVFVGARVVGGGGGGAGDGSIEAAAGRALDALEASLAEVGASPEDLIGVTSLHGDARDIDAALGVARDRLPTTQLAWTPVVVNNLPQADAAIALSAIAHIGREPIESVVPDTIAWWRQLGIAAGCRRGGLAVITGQFGCDADGNVNRPGDHAGQALNGFNRLREICSLLDIELDQVIDLLSLHQDPRGIDEARDIFANDAFADVGLSRRPLWVAAGVPATMGLGMLGQYRAIADPGGSLAVFHAEPPRSALGADPGEKVEQALDQLERTLRDRGLSLSQVVAIESLHEDMRALPEVAIAIRDRFRDDCPAWTAIGVTGLGDVGTAHSLRIFVARPT